MNSQQFFKMICIFIVSMILFSCTKTEKQKLINFNQGVIEWFAKPTFMNELKAKVKTPEQLQKYLQDNIAKIAVESGFQSQQESKDAFNRLENDADIKKIVKDGEAKIGKRLQEISRYGQELGLKAAESEK